MARKPRIYLPNCSYLILQQGNNLQRCFYCNSDYEHYLMQLSKASHRYQIAIHAFIILENAILLLLTPSTATGLARLMQVIGSNHVRYMNRKYQRTGTLFQGRHKESMIESNAYFIDCMSYVDLYAQQQELVSHPQYYPWSSYQINTSHTRVESITLPIQSLKISNIVLSPHPKYLDLGNNPLARMQLYKEQLQNKDHSPTFDFISKRLNASNPIATEKFIEKIERKINKKLFTSKPGRPKKSSGFPIILC